MKYKKTGIWSKVLIVVSILLASLIFVIFKIVPILKDKKEEAINEKAIQTVVKQVFTCPNEELIKLYSDMNSEIDLYLLEQRNDPDIDSTGLYIPNKNDISSMGKIDNMLMEMYAPYFTAKGYETFYEKMVYNVVYSTVLENKTEVIQVEIAQSETIPSNYSFTAFLRYGTIGGEKKDIKIEGSAQVTGEVGKLSYNRFFDKELYVKLWDIR